MRLFVTQRTEYRFTEPQARVIQLLRLTPSSHAAQNVVNWRIDVDCDARLKSGRDGYGNETTMLYVNGPVDHVGITVTGEVLTEDRAGMVYGTPEPLPPLVFLQSTPLTAASPEIVEFARKLADPGASAHDLVHRINHAVHARIMCDKDRNEPVRGAAKSFDEGSASCHDLAHIFIAAARSLGIPARFVSGHHRRPDGDSFHHVSHGWAEAHIGDMGWIGFDPACEICPDAGYVRVSVGLDHREAAPVSGWRIGGGAEILDVDTRVGLTQSQSQG
jgi:transglutaminase-like putative cysteine protease